MMKPLMYNSLADAAKWLSTRTEKAVTVSALIDAGCRRQLRIKVAVPPECLVLPSHGGYGLDPWPITGLLEFSSLHCLTLQAQGVVQMTSAKVNSRRIRFLRTVQVTIDMLRVSDKDLEAYVAISTKVPVNESVETVEVAVAPDHEAEAQAEAAHDDEQTTGVNLEKLFDPVGTSQLEKMFPAQGKWTNWAEKAARNGLSRARCGRAKFNPYLAALWWLEKQDPPEWDSARCRRKLANNLPERSLDSRHMLAEELE